MLFAALASVVLTACNDAGTRPGFAGIPSASGRVHSSRPDLLVCKAPWVTKPGVYPWFLAAGEIRRGTFVPTEGRQNWKRYKVIGRSPRSTAAGRRSIAPAPSNKPTSYVYTGTYTLNHTGQGCFDLFESHVKPGVWNALGNGYTQFGYNVDAKPLDGVWPAKVSVTVTATGGTGTVVLFNGNGQTWDRGTIVLTNRIPVEP